MWSERDCRTAVSKIESEKRSGGALFGRIVARFVEEYDPSRKCPSALSSPALVRACHAREHFIGTITNHLRGHAGNELRSPAGSRGTLFRFFGVVAIWYFYMCRKVHWILAISSPRLAHPPVPPRAVERQETLREQSRWRNEAGRSRFAIFAWLDEKKIGIRREIARRYSVSLNARLSASSPSRHHVAYMRDLVSRFVRWVVLRIAPEKGNAHLRSYTRASSTISSSRAASRNTSRSYFVTPISFFFFFFNREPYPNRAYHSFATSQSVRMLQVRKKRFSLTALYYIKYICTGKGKTELYIKRVRVHILDN